jgi:hypothetical protein
VRGRAGVAITLIRRSRLLLPRAGEGEITPLRLPASSAGRLAPRFDQICVRDASSSGCPTSRDRSASSGGDGRTAAASHAPVRSRSSMRASGIVNPAIAPAWAERNNDLRPVRRSLRTRLCRTGRKFSFSSGVISTSPIVPREKISECSQTRSSIYAFVRSSRAS